jgi:hypothetical protein
VNATDREQLPPLIIIIIVFMKRNSVCASSFFCFSSDNALHCIYLLVLATLKLPNFWSRRMPTSLRGTGASALPPLNIFHSLSALQRWQNCTQMRHRPQPSRRRCIPAQHRRDRTSPPNPASARLNDALPCLLRPNNCNYSKIYCCSSPHRCCLSDGGIMQVTQLRTWHNSSRTTTATATKCKPAT